eukprot:497691_1
MFVMADILKKIRNHLIVQRNQMFQELELKYSNYMMKLLQQQIVIKMNIQKQYDEQIQCIDTQLKNTKLMRCTHTKDNIPNDNYSTNKNIPRIVDDKNQTIIPSSKRLHTQIDDNIENSLIQTKSYHTKKMKKPKGLNAPKKNKSQYFLFRDDRFRALQSQNKDKSMGEISKMLSSEWKAMSQTQKKIYVQRAAKEKKRYLQEISVYKKTDNYRIYIKKLNAWKEQKKEWTKQNKTKINSLCKLNKIKKPKKPESMPKNASLSCYWIFKSKRTEELHEKYEKKNMIEITKLVAIEWQNTPQKKREIYEQEAIKQNEKRKLVMKKYKKCDEFKRYKQRLAEWKKRCKIIKEQAQNSKYDDIHYSLPRKPKCPRPKRPLTSFFLFAKHIREIVKFSKNQGQRDIAKEISKKWKKLSMNEKQKYNNEAMKLMEIYKREMNKYKGSKAEIEYEQTLDVWRQECEERKAD